MSNQEPTRTLWTKTLFEGLYTAIKNEDARAVKVALADLKAKEFPMSEITRHIQEDHGAQAVARFEALLKGPPKKEEPKGLVGKLKKFLGQ